MDLNTITEIAAPKGRDELGAWGSGSAWLAGGTWLFSEPQPGLSRLVDLHGLGWSPLEVDADGLTVAATCKLAQLHAFAAPPDWTAAELIDRCCRALLGSFKIWNAATVGGNICLALPAGPMTSLSVALDGVGTVWQPDGGQREVKIIDLVVGPQRTSLAPGELLRSIRFPAPALRRRTAFRQISLTPLGRSGALLIGTVARDGAFALTVTASVRRPLQFAFAALPEPAALADRLASDIPDALYYDDMHGRPDWRRHLTLRMAEEIRAELAGEARG